MLHTFFNLAPTNSITRNAKGKIFIQHCNTNIRKFSFSNRVPKYWNALSEGTKFAPDINNFKNLLDADQKLCSNFLEFDN